jgi:hypothetical protein
MLRLYNGRNVERTRGPFKWPPISKILKLKPSYINFKPQYLKGSQKQLPLAINMNYAICVLNKKNHKSMGKYQLVNQKEFNQGQNKFAIIRKKLRINYKY